MKLKEKVIPVGIVDCSDNDKKFLDVLQKIDLSFCNEIRCPNCPFYIDSRDLDFSCSLIRTRDIFHKILMTEQSVTVIKDE